MFQRQGWGPGAFQHWIQLSPKGARRAGSQARQGVSRLPKPRREEGGCTKQAANSRKPVRAQARGGGRDGGLPRVKAGKGAQPILDELEGMVAVGVEEGLKRERLLFRLVSGLRL
jgi:hypothetical protein